MKKLFFLILIPFMFQAKPLRVGVAGMTHGHVGQVYSAIKNPQQDVIKSSAAFSIPPFKVTLLQVINSMFKLMAAENKDYIDYMR